MTLHEKLLAVQTALNVPKGHKNTFGNYKYRKCEDILEAVKPLLKEQGLVLILSDDIVQVGDRFYVKATASVSVLAEAVPVGTKRTEEITVSAFAREALDKKGMDESQITGSASSYARKYALNGLFCIDDTADADQTNDHGKVPVASVPSTRVVEVKEPPKPAAPKKHASAEQLRQINQLCQETGFTLPQVYAKAEVKDGNPSPEQAEKIITGLEKFKSEKATPSAS